MADQLDDYRFERKTDARRNLHRIASARDDLGSSDFTSMDDRALEMKVASGFDPGNGMLDRSSTVSGILF